MIDTIPYADRDKTHGWPGVIGYVHEGDVYCPDCAEEIEAIDTSSNSRQAMLYGEESDSIDVCGAMNDCLNRPDGKRHGAPLQVSLIVGDHHYDQVLDLAARRPDLVMRHVDAVHEAALDESFYAVAYIIEELGEAAYLAMVETLDSEGAFPVA